MENKRFNHRERVSMATYPFEEFTYIADDGKLAELVSDEGTVHYRRLEFLESPADTSHSILVGTVRSVLFSKHSLKSEELNRP
jgi:hypothetical protein